MIEIDHLSVRFGARTVVNDVSIQVPAGHVIVLVGANGCGKSSILRAASGELPSRCGEIRMAGRPLNEWSRASAARQRAVLPQSSGLSFPFTAFDVVMLGRIPHAGRVSKSLDRHIATQALDAVDSGHLASHSYPTLSGGERQRVHLARVLAQVWPSEQSGNRYLLLDEPTNNLDVRHQHLVLEVARRAAAGGTGVLMVLHDLNLAAHYADAIVVLRDGMVISVGPPAVALTAESIQRAFGMHTVVVEHPLHRGPLILSLPAHEARHPNNQPN